MPGPFRPVYLDVKGEQSLEQLGLAIKMMLAERAPWNCFAAVNIAGSGMVQSRVSFSGDCHSSAQTDSDQSTTPASAWGQDPSNPRSKACRAGHAPKLLLERAGE